VIAQPAPIVSFAQLPSGWHAFNGVNGVYATSWNYHPNSSGWAASIPRGGIVVTVFFAKDTAHLPALKLVVPRHAATMLEGTTDTPEYRLQGRVNGRDVEVWIDIRKPHPNQTQLRIVQRVISALCFR
jgi:hypothetical protein